MTPHERLADWVRTRPASMTQVAAALGCSTNYLSRIINGRGTPGRRVANAIERETRGWHGQPPILASEWDDAVQADEDEHAA